MNIAKGSTAGETFIFGAGGASPVLSRVGNATLVLMGSASSASNYGSTEKFIINGAGAALPTVTNGMVAPYYLGATNGALGAALTFMTYDSTNGFKPATYDITGTSFAASDNTKKVNVSGAATLASNAAAYAVLVNGALTINPGVTLSIGDGTNAGLIVQANINGSTGGTIDFGSAEGVIAVNGTNPTISAAITGSNGITKTQYNGTNGTLTLTGVNTYTGTTTVNNGNLTFNSASAQVLGAITGLGTIGQSGTGPLQFTQTAGGTFGVGTLTAAAGSGTVTLVGGAGSATTINTINGGSGSMVIVGGDAGDPTASFTIASAPGTAGQLIDLRSGATTLFGRNFSANLQVDPGAVLNVPSTFGNNRLGLNGTLAGQTLAINGGQINVTGQFGARIGGDNGPGSAGNANFIVTANQIAGALTTSQPVNLGSTSAEMVNYNLSGGTLSVTGGSGVVLGSDTAGVGTTALTLSGTAKLIVSGVLSGSQATGAKQNFALNGGTLAASGVDMTKLTSSGAVAATVGTLLNNGATVAPGDNGVAGKTAITGNYSIASSAGALAVDIGGKTQATGFQTGQYDLLAVSGLASLNGSLNVSLINGFRPLPTDSFTIVTSSGLSGAFSNVAFGSTVTTTDGFGSFSVNQAGNNVVLTNFTPEPGAVGLLGMGAIGLLGRRRRRLI